MQSRQDLGRRVRGLVAFAGLALAEAIAHFRRLGLDAICDPDRKSRRAG